MLPGERSKRYGGGGREREGSRRKTGEFGNHFNVKENSSFEEYHKVSFIRGSILIIRMLYLSLMILFTYTFIFEYY